MPDAPSNDSMSPAARQASDYFNSLPERQRRRLVPLLEDFRLRGLREAREDLERAVGEVKGRQARIRRRIRDEYEGMELTPEPEPRCEDDEPLGTCTIHGDYWTDDCMQCGR